MWRDVVQGWSVCGGSVWRDVVQGWSVCGGSVEGVCGGMKCICGMQSRDEVCMWSVVQGWSVYVTPTPARRVFGKCVPRDGVCEG